MTVQCEGMDEGEIFELNGESYRVVYTKEDAAIYAEAACTSNLTDLSFAFENNSSFNKDILTLQNFL